MSPLYVFGRKQDLAFEKDVGGSADRRHHVRWWRAKPIDAVGRPLWIGDATFDRDAGISHLTGQITHHIAPDIDAERDHLTADLVAAGQLAGRYEWPGMGATLAATATTPTAGWRSASSSPTPGAEVAPTISSIPPRVMLTSTVVVTFLKAGEASDRRSCPQSCHLEAYPATGASSRTRTIGLAGRGLGKAASPEKG